MQTKSAVGSRWLFGVGVALAVSAAFAIVWRVEAQSEFTRSFEVDVQKYAGLWYELGRTPNDFEDNLPKLAGEKYGPCINSTASYTAISWNKLAVLNSCDRAAIEDTSRTRVDGVTGVAVLQKGTGNRKLKVAFGSKLARFFQRIFTRGGADYWIYGVGPENAEGQYNWALVSGPTRENIFILSREKQLPAEQLNEVLDLARAERLPVSELIYTQN